MAGSGCSELIACGTLACAGGTCGASSGRARCRKQQSWRPHQHSRRSCVNARMEVPDYLPATWSQSQRSKPIGPSLLLTAEDAVVQQLDALQINDHPYVDHGIEVMYRFAVLDPFQLSNYFGHRVDLGQFDKFRRIFHHSTYRILLAHKERQILSTLHVTEHSYKQRLRIRGARPDEEGTFEFTLVQMVGGSWDGYWFTESLHHDGERIIRAAN